ncbi:MAG TPA: hypothetical protein VL137_09825, partial [Polyangiaceae bacterium]|nr:hypothetical protein [Polyangiaceae bacterium]
VEEPHRFPLGARRAGHAVLWRCDVVPPPAKRPGGTPPCARTAAPYFVVICGGTPRRTQKNPEEREKPAEFTGASLLSGRKLIA